MTTKKGTVKKTPLKDYANIRTNGLIAINLDDGDELRWIKKTTGSNDIIISTSAGQAIRFNETDARPMGRAARGVRGARLRPNDVVVGMDVVNSEEQTLLVISEKGFGKRTTAANFPSHKRGGVGIKAAIVTAKTGPIISVQTIDPEMTDAILISKNGQTIRLRLADIKLLGRTTQGVTIMRLAEGDKVSSIGMMPEQVQAAEAEEE
jgi:DNA gyrase subunit A